MVLGGGDGSKPSVSFLKFEPEVSNFLVIESGVTDSITRTTIKTHSHLER